MNPHSAKEIFWDLEPVTHSQPYLSDRVVVVRIKWKERELCWEAIGIPIVGDGVRINVNLNN